MLRTSLYALRSRPLSFTSATAASSVYLIASGSAMAAYSSSFSLRSSSS
jgi:hypothetical protein